MIGLLREEEAAVRKDAKREPGAGTDPLPATFSRLK
jgi:hypothetical protein